MKDLKKRVRLIKGHHKNELYTMPQPTPNALLSITLQHLPWHHTLGHLSENIVRHFSFFPRIKMSTNLPCISCNTIKSHKLSFFPVSLTSIKPLDLVYTYVSGPTPTKSLDQFIYYLVFVDHFTKCIWLYPMKYKSNVSIIPKLNVLLKFF